ncbi:YrdB family protein [Microbacterium gilvum]|uniref:YrdB family protein n=1 Tax=Microbacterium gilvum TaxID=1336204 RepID=A0ABP9AQG7_9MICO
MPDPSASATAGVTPRRITVLDLLRFASELVAVIALAVWGFLAWAFPWNVVVGIGAPVLAAIVWALFVSPKAVVAVHPFVRAVVELCIFLAATIALWGLGQPWAGLVFALFAIVVGLLHNRRSLS